MKIRKHSNPCVARAAAKFRPWDYGFMLEIEAKCLAEMAKYFETSKIAVDDAIYARYCRQMTKLLAIATDNDVSYYTPPEIEIVNEGDNRRITSNGEGKMSKYVNTKNAHRFITDFDDTPLMRDILRREKAWYLYSMMRLQYLRHCWD